MGKKLFRKFIDNKIDLIFNAYLSRNTSKVLRELIYLTDKVNSFIHENKPWEISKNLSPSKKRAEKPSFNFIYFNKMLCKIDNYAKASSTRIM